jgi:phosphoglycolate phosphatase
VSVPPPRFSGDRAILFDLDGTLVETRRDIAAGVNVMLAERGLGPLSVDDVSRHVGRGARVLVTRCLAACGVDSPSEETIDAAYTGFHDAYSARLLDTTLPYPGIVEMCARLDRAGVAMAIVSNKPEDLSRRILEGLGLARFFPVVLGGDSLPVRKPDPAPLLHALKLLGIDANAGARNPDGALMVGDSVVDVQAARAAGLPVAAVTWGFGSREELLAAGPDRLVADAEELTGWVLSGRS